VWLRSETNGAQRVNRNVSKEAKLVLRYVYSDMRRDWHERYTFQIDHQLPIGRLSRILERNRDPGWPMSAVGNLALLPDFMNADKSMLTPREYLDSLQPSERVEQTQIMTYATFFDIDRLVIPEDGDGNDEMSRNEYIQLVESRQEVVREKVLVALGFTEEERK
jgi:hypothetical protein